MLHTKRDPQGVSFGVKMAGGLGFEPRLEESESSVLPLDDPPMLKTNDKRIIEKDKVKRPFERAFLYCM